MGYNIMETVIRLTDLVAPSFIPFWKDKSYYKILKGGRSSTKSSNISLKLVIDFLQDPNANIVCFRKVAKYISTSIYEQIKWAIYQLKVENEFTFLVAPQRIIHNETKSAFYFFGVDDPLKIKGATIAIGYVIALWFEEATEFDDVKEIDTVADTFVREKLPDNKHVDIYFSYNPPRNPYVWINEWAEEKERDKDYFIHQSDYESDGVSKFLSKQILEKIEQARENDFDYWRWMYKGEVIGLGDTVYNYKLFNVINEIPDDDRIIFADIAIDSGYSTSATTFIFTGYTIKRKSIVLDTYYYSPVNQLNKKAPSDFSKELWEFTQENIKKWKTNIDSWTIDSAEGALRNQFNKDYGIYLTPARKKIKVKMIENVEDLLVQDRVYVLNNKNNSIFLEEHKKYQWDEKTLNTADPKVVKENDHTCDAFQYYVNNNLEKLGLKM
jgi:phage terminase large subunit